MTTITLTRTSANQRILRSMHLHTATLPQLVLWIAAILSAIFVVQYAIILAISDPSAEINTSTPIVLSIFLFVFGVQALAQTLPFALSLGLTRRAFFHSTLLYLAVLSLILSLATGFMAFLEEVTGGWGQEFTFFRVPAMVPVAPIAQWTLVPLVIMTGGVLGMFFGAVYQRWNTTGVWSVALTLVLLGGLVTVVTIWQGWWPTIWQWLNDIPLETSVLAGPALVALTAGIAAYAITRRSPV
ncbi:ABC transporter permease [Hoyosella subflava]|uniref:Possible ABC transporter permease n=1 Tax=Hoyosella subflava (strain DSM 45089 / JCM 17490 / NBRC 109087 / DQS3-9A1) TaxID=443218 RepID=F6EIY8_HOYSD|nr:ABC transporter permease [Hoyosella subflava]AEF40049.1 Possible ABC transporter permease [Hoyosella subflava DQS3-9A1]